MGGNKGKSIRKPKTHGVHWSNGRDPEDYGWSFDEGGSCTGYDCVGIETWDEVNDLIGPTLAKMMFDGNYRPREIDMFLQDKSRLFRT